MPQSSHNSLQQLDADAFEHMLALGRAQQRTLVHDPHVAGRRLGEPAVAEHDGLGRAVVGRHLPRQHVAQQAGALDVAALPAEVARGDAGHAVVALLGAGRPHRVAHHEDRGRHALGHHVVARGHAARDLDVHHLVLAPLAVASAATSVAAAFEPLLARVRVADADLGQPAFQPRHVFVEAEQPAGRRRASRRRCRRRR
jgi:hypothetical protein